VSHKIIDSDYHKKQAVSTHAQAHYVKLLITLLFKALQRLKVTKFWHRLESAVLSVDDFRNLSFFQIQWLKDWIV